MDCKRNSQVVSKRRYPTTLRTCVQFRSRSFASGESLSGCRSRIRKGTRSRIWLRPSLAARCDGDRLAFPPVGGDVYRRGRMNVVPARRTSAVRHEVHLHTANLIGVPADLLQVLLLRVYVHLSWVSCFDALPGYSFIFGPAGPFLVTLYMAQFGVSPPRKPRVYTTGEHWCARDARPISELLS